MSKFGSIVIVEDDIDDQEIIEDVLKDLGVKNQLVFFSKAPEAFDHLKNDPNIPFLIFCDINLPQVSGLEFKMQIDTDKELRKKSIPFIFFSTAVNKNAVNEAFTEMTVQGFFQKGHNMHELKNTLRLIIDYWMLSKHPNSEG